MSEYKLTLQEKFQILQNRLAAIQDIVYQRTYRYSSIDHVDNFDVGQGLSEFEAIWNELKPEVEEVLASRATEEKPLTYSQYAKQVIGIPPQHHGCCGGGEEKE